MCYTAGLLIVGLLLTGCETLGDIFIPPHSNSKATRPEVLCVEFTPSGPEAAFLAAPFVAAEAAAIVGGLVDITSKAIERESKQYGATYSGRTVGHILNVSNTGEVRLNTAGFRIKRYY